MVKGDKSESMRNNRRMVRSKEGSDESDEDYMVGEEEELDESEDEYCSPFDGDESEEFLDELEEEEDDDEEEEFVERKVRKVGRPKVKKTGHARGRKKNGFVKPKRKKRASYRDEEEEEDDDDDDVNFNFSDERTNKATKPRRKKRILESEEEDDYDCADYDFDDEKKNETVKQRKKKRVSYREEDDDGVDDDFDDEKVDIAVRPRGKKGASSKEDEDDDDYDVANDMLDDEKVCVARSRLKKKASYKEEEDDDYGVENEIYDDELVSQVAKPRKKKEVSYREEEDDDYDGSDDDDDDEEFTPDEIDGVEDEDDLVVAEKNKKVGRPRLQEKVVTVGRKSKRNSRILKKTMTKRPRNDCRRRRTIKNENNGELIGSESIVEENIKKVNGRKRRRTVISDSDCASSGSSDFEYTISEEEREQVQEANRFCRGLSTSLRSSTSFRKLEDEKEMPTQRKRPVRKGKEKVEEMKVESGKQVCGICLTEEGKRTVRGTLNCCSHYFCFACIMEWSKVESRCPLCKQRFVTISKPARLDTGFDLRTVVIPIPERDQVYQPSEEELQGFLDPYDNVICTECHQGGDDALMLLCDLCDSPAHTYCVGLGHEVPDGNWYCEGCRPDALGSSNPQVLTPTPDFRTNSNLSVRSSPVSGIRETFDLNEIYVPDTPLTHETSQLQSPRPSVRDVLVASPAPGTGAFTVLERRRIQLQIHQLLNSRRRQMDDRVPHTPTTVSGHSLFGSQVGRSRELATQHVPIQERMPSSNTYFPGSSRDNTMPAFQNRNLPSARIVHTGAHLSQSQPSTSSNRSYSGYMQEFDGLNTSIGLRLGHQQLQPCSGSSNIGPDANRSSYPFREDGSYCHEVPDACLGFTLVTHPDRE